MTANLAIPEAELTERFIRASGPGGQHVNKVESAVQLRFDVDASPSLSVAVKARLKALAGRRMTREGVLVIDARRSRDQAMNRADARARLADLITRASRPAKKRKPTGVPFAQKQKRLQAKKRRSETKSRRGRPLISD